ncbi:2-succinyl-5-enolpyruvyl-6-hydroxy-3-cyclohexene-1-carboxylic-acid synthase [Halobacillus rhizosphaerae]|uniref:2-succinyl-5-enolpyruvyl-6-hydroxy-3- cyclohexene-1-carboxylic-acid synthase n=1 Tax=Halobacillus rhizosphaerae TaxID=3064889 RepID=UPI00398B5B67
MEDHIQALSKFVTHFVDQLVYSGVENVVISPGSRSTPLAMTFAEHQNIKHWMNLDERSAAFFALGMAKEQQAPVALVCTSGTAAANYYPAIVEAYYSRIPLIVLTADRPHELREVGAPQAIDQSHMYGKYVKWHHDMALPELSQTGYSRRQAARAVDESLGRHAGPVHVNFPFREPLIPDFNLEGLWRKEEKPIPRAWRGTVCADRSQIQDLYSELGTDRKGLIVCGPQTDEELAEPITELANRLGVPVFADPLSQLRTGKHDKRNIIENYDSLLKSQEVKDRWQPDYIIRFGAMPVSKAYLQWIRQYDHAIDHFIVDEYSSFREPAGITAQFIWSEPKYFCRSLAEYYRQGSVTSNWLTEWKEMNVIAKNQMLLEPDNDLNEGHAVVYLSEAVPDGSILFVGNSMPIRDVDSFFMSTPKQVKIMANRGANGIDGVISSALGAASSGKQVTLLLGDVSFFHDMNGLLLAKQKNLSITIVVINNDGGGIFSYLPQVNHKDHFEEVFGTPLGINLKPAVEMYGGIHHQVTSWNDYKRALEDSYLEQGLSVVEVITSRDDHVGFHKAKWGSIKEEIEQWGGI